MKKVLFKLTAVMLTFTLLFSTLTAIPAFSKDTYDPPIKFGVVSDPHYFPEKFCNTNSKEFLHDAYCDSKLMGESAAILKATLETIAVRKAQGTYDMKYLLVPGDLTFDGEKAGHIEIAALFKAFEKKTGIQIFVINGNHDINNYKAADYATADGKKITASDNPELLLTTPEDFREIYADFGYSQADSIFVPSKGKAGGLSYAVSLPGGYRLIAIDSCIYSSDVTSGGTDANEGGMSITPELFAWVLKETKEAKLRGETVIGMAHGSVVEHFSLERALSKNSMINDYENISYQLADAGMHFIFTGHLHANDIASTVSANNETIYDIETCCLINIPDTYREVSFSKGLVAGNETCTLNNVDCDAACNVDVSGIWPKYGIIEKPFSENYCMPMIYGGSIEQGIKSDGAEYFNRAFLARVAPEIKKVLPNGLAGLLKEKGINLGDKLANASPSLKSALKGYNFTPQAFSQFLNAIVTQIDNKYILDTSHTEALISAAVAKFAHFDIAQGNSATEFGKIALLAVEYNAIGNENPLDNPEIQAAVNALRTQAGADRFIDELLDIVINDVLFDDILPSISLNDLDTMLPANVMTVLRTIAGNDLTVGGILDKILNTAASSMNSLPFVNIKTGRDLVKALVYTVGYKYLNAGTRLKISNAFADLIVSFTTDNNPFVCGDANTTLQYDGKVNVVPTAANYRLPADISIAKGANIGDIIITWNTIQGIEGSNIEMNPLPAAVQITVGTERIEKSITMLDFGVMTLNEPRVLLKHTVTINGLESGVNYSFKIGDSGKNYMSAATIFSIDENGNIQNGSADGENDFFSSLLSNLTKILEVVLSFKTIVNLLT